MISETDEDLQKRRNIRNDTCMNECKILPTYILISFGIALETKLVTQ